MKILIILALLYTLCGICIAAYTTIQEDEPFSWRTVFEWGWKIIIKKIKKDLGGKS